MYIEKIRKVINASAKFDALAASKLVMTPEKLAREMISYLVLFKEMTIFNPCSKDGNIEFTWLIMMLEEFGDNEENFRKFFSQITIGVWHTDYIRRRRILKIIKKLGLLRGKYVILNTDIESITKGYDMKFDAIIMNPPYNNGKRKISDEILTAIYNSRISDNITSIQPLNFLTTSSESSNKTSTFNKHIKSIIFKNPNKIWAATFQKTLIGIINIDYITHGNVVIDNNHHINFGKAAYMIDSETLDGAMNYKHKLYLSIIKKVASRKLNTFASVTTPSNPKTEYNSKNKWFTDYEETVGHIDAKGIKNYFYNHDFFSVAYAGSSKPSDNIDDFTNKAGHRFCYEFSTKEEAEHAWQFVFSNLVKLLISNVKQNMRISTITHNQVPLFNFSTPVTNERIQKEFNLTDVEMNFIDDFGKQLNGENVDWEKYD